MITRFLSFRRRRWAYGLVEIGTMGVFCFTAFRLITNNPYRFGLPTDPGMARATAGCFVVISAVLFVSINLIKRSDTGK